MWVIFVLATITIAIAMLFIVYVANEVFISMKRSRIKSEKEFKEILEQEKKEENK